MAGEGTGWGGAFHLHNGTALTELVNVTEIGFPEDQIDEVEVTPLKAAGRRKVFIAGLIDAGSFDVTMNYVAGDADDVLCRAQLGQVRNWKIVVPDATGTAERQLTGSGLVKGYKVNPMQAGEAMTCVLTIRVSGAVTEGAAA